MVQDQYPIKYEIRLKNHMNREFEKNGLSKLYWTLKRRYDQILKWREEYDKRRT